LIDPLVFPPLGILYLSSVLKQRGYEVEVIDLGGGGKLPDIRADIIGITSTNAQYQEALRIRDELKHRDPNSWVILGGPRATCDPDSCINDGFDQVVVGEGEGAIVRIAEGCLYRIMREPPIEDLNEIPFPDRDAINIHRYHYSLDGMPATNIISSRGCPYACAFCCKTWGRGFRLRSSENVLQEARLLKDKYHFEGLQFYDDEMLLNRKRDLEIFRGLRDLGMIFRCFTRANLVDDKMARAMSRCGCREVLIGVESGSDRILDSIRKGTTRELNKRAIGLLRGYGIRVKAAFIVGLPGESWDTIKETESFIEECQADEYDFSILQVFPLSAIYENPSAFDVKFERGSGSFFKGKPGHYSEISPISTSHMTFEEIVSARDELERKYKKW